MRISIEEIKKRIFDIYGDLIYLDEITYIGTNKKCRFFDKDYGEFWNTPCDIYKRGRIHKIRSKQISREKRRMPIDELKKRLFEAHGEQVIIDESTYVKYKIKARFIDKKYGEWNATPMNVIQNKTRHPKRFAAERSLSEEFLASQRKKFLNPKFQQFMKDCTKKKFGVENVFSSKIIQDQIKQTCIRKYGVDSPNKNKEISLRGAQTQNKITILKHWFSNEDVKCQGTYETAVVEYLNSNKINFSFHPQTFSLPDGRTYTPDLHLTDQDLWIEVKGTFRFWDPTDDALEKWNWFRSEHPDSELWDQNKLKELGIWKRIQKFQIERRKIREQQSEVM